MEETVLVAAIAAFALGANVLGISLLLLFNPRSRRVRWYALFTADICAWLFLQTWIFGRQETGHLLAWYEASVHLLPGLFLANVVAVDLDRGNRVGWAIVALAVATLPISIGHLASGTGAMPLAWQVAGWTVGIVLQWRGERPMRVDPRTARKMRITIMVGLLLIGPAAVLYGWLSDSGAFFAFAMPLLTVLIQFLLFMGVVHLRYYDIEVRALRTGEMAARATELERLAVVGEIAASLAHEVRNPLTGVRSLAQRIAEDDVDDDRRRRYADVIVRETGRVEQIVSNLLGVARRVPEEPGDGVGPTPLGPLFEDVSLLVAGRARKGEVVVETLSGDLSAPVAREPLAQALLNLLLNAVDHSPPGGRVEIEARAGGEGVTISVRDQGPGVPPEDRERVFEPLYSGGAGTGLGLAVVRRIADARGWSVAVGDADGGGAVFRIGIPG